MAMLRGSIVIAQKKVSWALGKMPLFLVVPNSLALQLRFVTVSKLISYFYMLPKFM